ncbi:MAG: hypothetical protein ACREPV_01790 [Lysobacter sp.]
MKLLAIGVIALSTIAAPALAADVTPDLAQCDRIVDVEVPYEVDASTDALRFSDGDKADIVVTGARIESGDRTLQDASITGYHADLRGFLDNAGSMANVAKSFLGNRGAFPQAATDMCSAILAVQRSGQAMEQRFPGFVSPVRVTLE